MNHDSKVLLVGLGLVPSTGGTSNTIRKFRDALEGQVVSFSDPRKLAAEGSAFEGIAHIPLNSDPLGTWYGYASRQKRVAVEELAFRAELLTCHVMLRYHANWVSKMAKKFDIPYLFIPHGQLDPWVYTYRATQKKLWFAMFGKRFLQNAAKVVFSTAQEKSKARWAVPENKGVVIHWPVNLIDIEDKKRARTYTLNKIDAQPSSKILIYLGRLHPMKRPVETIKAFCEANRNKDSHLIVVGMEQGVSINHCQQVVEVYGMSHCVHILGPIFGKEKETLLLGADAYISRSFRENFGHTAAEALAAATPVILSPGNDLAPELTPYECGWFLNDDSDESAVTAIRQFLSTNQSELLERGLRGRQFIAEKCSFEGFARSLHNLRDEVLETKS